jgi:hypothetical protein
MASGENDEKSKSAENAGSKPPTVRKVTVTHLDEPPPSGKRTIHPRRPAPIVPTREERTAEPPAEDTNPDKPASE